MPIADADPLPRIPRAGIAEPLRTPLFRRVWTASLFSNLGLLIQAVGAAWAMTMLAGSADTVALVQTALMLPVMLIAVPAGAIADMYDRRKVALAALGFALAGATALAAITALGLLTPARLLAFCFAIGAGNAAFGPAWQASVREQVPAAVLPQAVALNSISYNIARSFGPAIGGVIVAAAGAVAAFAANALCYLPLLFVFALWRREQVPSRLPPEGLRRAIASGGRYVVHTPTIRIVLWRTLVLAIAGSSLSALMPIVARDLLGGGALTYGVILGAFGIGAVAGALAVGGIRERVEGEHAVAAGTLVLAAAIGAVGMSRALPLTVVALVVAGAAWMVCMTLFNIAIQIAAPRWVSGRTLATYQAAVAGGIAIGSWAWGRLAEDHGVAAALLASALAMAASSLLGRRLRMPAVEERDREPVELGDPQVALALTARSGPIVVEIEYRVDPAQARDFYGTMQRLQHVRQRNGAFAWSIARDVADPALWIERFHCPTWLDYLRQRNRSTPAERGLQEAAFGFHAGDAPVRIRRMLERPFGSVRWSDAAPDPDAVALPPMGAGLGTA